MAGAQAVHEGAGVLQGETRVEEGADLLDEPYVGLVVLAVAVARTPRHQKSLLLVIAERTGADAGAFGQLSDPHRSSLSR